MAGHLTFALIKPHAVKERKVGDIIKIIEENKFGIVLAKLTQFRLEGAKEFYIEHEGKEFFNNLTRIMCSGPVWSLVLSKPNAVAEWRALIGNTNSAEAEIGTIRHTLGHHDNITLNAVHGSATDHDARREINFFFSREIKLAERLEELGQ